jgi:hypothetical protein
MGKLGQGSREKLIKQATAPPAIKRQTKKGTIDRAGHKAK